MVFLENPITASKMYFFKLYPLTKLNYINNYAKNVQPKETIMIDKLIFVTNTMLDYYSFWRGEKKKRTCLQVEDDCSGIVYSSLFEQLDSHQERAPGPYHLSPSVGQQDGVRPDLCNTSLLINILFYCNKWKISSKVPLNRKKVM